MPLLKEPIETTTTGGYAATVTANMKRNTDQLEGYVQLPTGRKDVRWDYGGRCRDNPTELNLDMRLPAHASLRTPVPRASKKTQGK